MKSLGKSISDRWYILALLLIVLLAFWFRSFPARFNELQALDPFFIYRENVVLLDNNFQMPEMDAIRHYPFGSIWGYAAPIYLPSALYVMLSFIGINMPFLNFAIICPAILGALAVIIMFFIGKELFNYKAGLLAAFFLATIPAFITRTSAGFFEKESIIAIFMLLTIYFSVLSFKKTSWKYGILSGLSLGALGLSGGMVQYMYLLFSGFVLILLFLNQYSDKLFKAFVPTLFLGPLIPQILISYAHVPWTSASVLLCYGVLVILLLRHSVSRFNLLKKEQTQYFVPGLMIFAVMGLLIGTMFFDPASDFLQEITGAITIERGVAMQTVAENAPGSWNDVTRVTGMGFAGGLTPQLNSITPYFALWIFMLLGILVLVYKFYSTKNWLFILPMFWIFSGIYAQFSMIRLSFLLGPPAALIGGYFVSWLISRGSKLKTSISTKKTEIAFIGLGALFMILALISLVENIFVSIIFVSTGAILILFGYTIKKSDTESFFGSLYKFFTRYKPERKIDIILIPLIIILIFIISFNTANAYIYSQNLGPSICFPRDDEPCITISEDGDYVFAENQPWYEAMGFLASETPEDSNILSWWDFGYWFQTRGKRPSVTDGGGAGPRYDVAIWFVANPNNWTDFDPWLKDKYGVDYILMDYTLPGKYGAISTIASNGEQPVGILQFQQTGVHTTENKTIYEYSNGPYALWVPIADGNLAGSSLFLISQDGQYYGKNYINDVCTTDGILKFETKEPSMPGCITITPLGVYYIPQEAEYTIFTNLMFMDGHGLPIEKVFDNYLIKIYKVIY